MWETSPPAAPLLLKERFDKTLVPLLSKERLGEVLPDHTKLSSQLRRGLSQLIEFPCLRRDRTIRIRFLNNRPSQQS